MLKTITNFKDKNTHDFFFGKRVKKWEKISESARAKLKILNCVSSLPELINAFDARLHKLHGNREGQWSVSINKQYRICFYWIKSHAYEVEITDYH